MSQLDSLRRAIPQLVQCDATLQDRLRHARQGQIPLLPLVGPRSYLLNMG